MKTFSLFFALMFVNYGLNAISIRMVARGHYWGVAGADAAIALLGFSLIQRVAQAETIIAQAGYVVGGVCGSVLGVWLTRKEKTGG